MSKLHVQARISVILCTKKKKVLGKCLEKNMHNIVNHFISNSMKFLLFIKIIEAVIRGQIN